VKILFLEEAEGQSVSVDGALLTGRDGLELQLLVGRVMHGCFTEQSNVIGQIQKTHEIIKEPIRRW
jgi:hypothetical protein